MTEIEGKRILVLGGGGMVGVAVCRKLLQDRPSRITVASRRESKARKAVETLQAEFPDRADTLITGWGDVFLRAEWHGRTGDIRATVLAAPETRRRAIANVLDPLCDEILHASLLEQMIMGTVPAPAGKPQQIVIDCMNTATAVSYQDIYSTARRLAGLAAEDADWTDWPTEIEMQIAALSVPQLVRHVQILYAAMRKAGTIGYVKVGTSGTGGMGFNIPYTHGEEKPSRLLLSKAALAGVQTMLTFLMARTPDAPLIVREIKPAAMIGWHAIGHGAIHRRGRSIAMFDCPPDRAVPLGMAGSLVPRGDFGIAAGGDLDGVYIHTGENGLFSADEFAAITTLGQMQMITPEDVAQSVVAELRGASTGRDVVGALDAAASGPTYRAGYLRQTALARLRDLESRHGPAIAYEILGPPRLSKLLYEAHLLNTVHTDLFEAVGARPEELSCLLECRIAEDVETRRRILSIGIPILLPDGERLLRGPEIKAANAHDGWVDLTPGNMTRWQARISGIRNDVLDVGGDGFSKTEGRSEFGAGHLAPGEIVGWIFSRQEGGVREMQ